MATQNCAYTCKVLWQRAKELLKREDYDRLKTAIKTFSKTRSVEGLCSDLLKIVNSRSKVEILVEVRRCLPENLRNKFTRHCNELLEAEVKREGDDSGIKRKVGIKEGENTALNLQGSPTKKTRPGKEKPRKSKEEKIISTGPVCSKDSTSFGIETEKAVLTDAVDSDQESKIIVLERKSLNHGFGFKIRGGTCHHPSITVAQVTKHSLADKQGLKTGDKIIRVNNQRCGKRNLVDITQVIANLIKASKSLHMRIIPAEDVSKKECKIRDKPEPAVRVEEKRLSTVSVHPNEDGWLGCCIRGGTDYGCDVFVISVDNHSPAQRAGLKTGNVIVKVNRIRTKDLTHVQVVRLVIFSGPCVTFSVRSGYKQKKSLWPELVRVEATPLQTQYGGPHNVTSLGSPTSKGLHPPGYQRKPCGAVVDSPSQLPFDVMNLNCMPPPPYTPEVPLRHRVLARGEERHEEINGQGQYGFMQEPQVTQDQRLPLDINHQQETSGVFQQQIQNTSIEQDKANNRNKTSLNGNKDNIPRGSRVVEKYCVPGPAILVPEEIIMLSMEKEALIDGSQTEMSTILELPPPPPLLPLESDNRFPSVSLSPVTGNGRESFLSQIRQFNKTSLKKPIVNSEVINCNQFKRIPNKSDPEADDRIQITKDEKNNLQGNGVQEKGDPMNLLSALHQAMKHRAKVLHDTLTDEGNGSDANADDDNFDDNESEWEL